MPGKATSMTRIPLASLLLSLLAASGVQADNTRDQPPSIVVSGTGTASSAPDQAQIEFGVVMRAADAKRALQENASVLMPF